VLRALGVPVRTDRELAAVRRDRLEAATCDCTSGRPAHDRGARVRWPLFAGVLQQRCAPNRCRARSRLLCRPARRPARLRRSCGQIRCPSRSGVRAGDGAVTAQRGAIHCAHVPDASFDERIADLPSSRCHAPLVVSCNGPAAGDFPRILDPIFSKALSSGARNGNEAFSGASGAVPTWIRCIRRHRIHATKRRLSAFRPHDDSEARLPERTQPCSCARRAMPSTSAKWMPGHTVLPASPDR